MGPVARELHDRLNRAFAPLELDISDDSGQHRGHAGYREGIETHFTVRLVSSRFAGQTRVARQRSVHAELADLMNNPIHALSLKLAAPGE